MARKNASPKVNAEDIKSVVADKPASSAPANAPKRERKAKTPATTAKGKTIAASAPAGQHGTPPAPSKRAVKQRAPKPSPDGSGTSQNLDTVAVDEMFPEPPKRARRVFSGTIDGPTMLARVDKLARMVEQLQGAIEVVTKLPEPDPVVALPAVPSWDDAIAALSGHAATVTGMDALALGMAVQWLTDNRPDDGTPVTPRVSDTSPVTPRGRRSPTATTPKAPKAKNNAAKGTTASASNGRTPRADTLADFARVTGVELPAGTSTRKVLEDWRDMLAAVRGATRGPNGVDLKSATRGILPGTADVPKSLQAEKSQGGISLAAMARALHYKSGDALLTDINARDTYHRAVRAYWNRDK